MKKRFAALTAALCILLAGCGPKQGEAKEPYDSADVAALLDSGIFSEVPEQLDADIICPVFGVDSALVKECAAYLPTGLNSEALALFVLEKAEDAGAVEEAVRSWVSDQIESFADYGPNEVPKLEGAVVSVRENTVLLVVGSEPAAAQTAVDGLNG